MFHFLIEKFKDKEPSIVIGHDGLPYLKRWYIIPRNKYFNIYLHQFLRSDDDRALHDHPWFSLSHIIEGSYNEVLKDKTEIGRAHV